MLREEIKRENSNSSILKRRTGFIAAALLLGVAAIAGTGLTRASEASETSGAGSAVGSVTFSKDVAPIFFAECAQCHRPNDLAPMSLLTYKDARPWARSIREKVVKREMPPWHADPHYGQFSNDRRLTEKQVNTIVAWVDQGAKEGDPRDLPAAPDFAEGWHIGKPDVVLTMSSDFNFAAEGPDEYRYFKKPTNFKENVWVQAGESKTGNRKIGHHIIAFIVNPPPKQQQQQPTEKKTAPAVNPFLDAFMKNIIFYEDGHLNRVKADVPVFDDGCATKEGGSGIFKDGSGKDDDLDSFLCATSPGRDADAWDEGMAKKIPAGATIVHQIHYTRSGRADKDRSSIGHTFA